MTERIIEAANILYATRDHESLKDFLTANGINPDDVMKDEQVLVTNDYVAVVGFARDADGRRVRVEGGKRLTTRKRPFVKPLKHKPEEFGL